MTSFTTYIGSLEDIERVSCLPRVTEVLLEPELLCVRGRLSKEETLALARQARARSLRTVLVWDTLMPQRDFEKTVDALSRWPLERFDAVRVRDLGAAEWLLNEHPDIPLQLVLEYHSQNVEALTGWVQCFGVEKLERLILSVQLTEEGMLRAIRSLPVPIEVLAAGPLQIFATPRALISPFLSDSDGPSAPLEGYLSAEESSHRDFPTVESRHGTYMYLHKDYFILDRITGLESAGLAYARIDLVQHSSAPHQAEQLVEFLETFERNPEEAAAAWPRKTIAQFFRSNKTTAQFRRLKSHLHSLRDEQAVALVVATEDKRATILTLQPFESSEALTLELPDGKQIACDPFELQDLEGVAQTKVDAEQVLLTSRIKYAVPTALLRRPA